MCYSALTCMGLYLLREKSALLLFTLFVDFLKTYAEEF
jgi:hypothetical protein